MTCTANGKPLCRDGVQTRHEGGTRGMVELPCKMCRPEEHSKWAELWKAEEKPVKEPVQQSMFDRKKAEGYPG